MAIKKLPTATNRAIAVEHLTHHIHAASNTGDTIMSPGAARWIAERLIDGPAYEVRHLQRSDRVVLTLNPPEVGQPLPVLIEGDMTERIHAGSIVGQYEEAQRGKPYQSGAESVDVRPGDGVAMTAESPRKWGDPPRSEGDRSPDDVAATGTDETYAEAASAESESRAAAEAEQTAGADFDPDR